MSRLFLLFFNLFEVNYFLEVKCRHILKPATVLEILNKHRISLFFGPCFDLVNKSNLILLHVTWW